MRKLFAALAAAGVVAAAWFGFNLRTAYTESPPAAAAGTQDTTHDRLVVHEWGTFTSFSGSNGVRLDFRPLADNDLPEFVFHRGMQAGAVYDLIKSRTFVRERMETPITYFYTDREREVQVKVGFPQGLLTEFYPPVARMLPAFHPKQTPEIKNSELDWGTVRLIPTSKLRTSVSDPKVEAVLQERLLGALLPATYGNHYEHARETDSALVHAHYPADPQRPNAPAGDFFEKFLFYRGIGAFELPIRVEALSGGRFEVQNQGADPIRALFLVTAEGQELRLTTAVQIGANGRLMLTQSSKTVSMDELANQVADSLVAEGLYRKEALSMVNTWRQSWFGEQGTRLFYLVPKRLTDELLPLTISPQPDELVRVLVGRYEIMSPEDEARVTELVKQSVLERAKFVEAQAALEATQRKPYVLPKGIKGLGRLAEPALVRVRTLAKDPVLKAEASALLYQWAAERGVE